MKPILVLLAGLCSIASAEAAPVDLEAALADREAYQRNPKLAQYRAAELFPQLGLAGSPLHREFMTRLKNYRTTYPVLFKDPTWPLVLAQECKIAIGAPGALPLPAIPVSPITQKLRNGGTSLDRTPGGRPEQAQDGSIPEIHDRIKRRLKDPDSLIYEGWELSEDLSPGGNPAWVAAVTYRAKNSYGGYDGNTTERYWLDPKGEWRQIIR